MQNYSKEEMDNFCLNAWDHKQVINWNIYYRTMHDLDLALKSYIPSETLMEKSYIPSQTLLEKTKFSFASRCQSWIDSWLGMWACLCFPPSMVELWLEPVQVLCMLPTSLWVLMCVIPVMSGEYCFPDVFHHLWLLQSFHDLFLITLWALRWGAFWRPPI